MREIAKLEPESADPYYFIGEAYRFKGDYRRALENYNNALKVDSQFGAAYLGLARARLMQDSNADITLLLAEAIKRDPNFGEVYLERAMYYLDRKQPDLALADLETAEKLMPGSPLVYYHMARAYLALEKPMRPTRPCCRSTTCSARSTWRRATPHRPSSRWIPIPTTRPTTARLSPCWDRSTTRSGSANWPARRSIARSPWIPACGLPTCTAACAMWSWTRRPQPKRI